MGRSIKLTAPKAVTPISLHPTSGKSGYGVQEELCCRSFDASATRCQPADKLRRDLDRDFANAKKFFNEPPNTTSREFLNRFVPQADSWHADCIPAKSGEPPMTMSGRNEHHSVPTRLSTGHEGCLPPTHSLTLVF